MTLVLSKDFLQTKNKNLLECIFRNVPGIYTPFKNKITQKITDENRVTTKPSPKQATPLPFSTGKIQVVENLLDRINSAIPNDELRFQITKHYGNIEKKNGGYYSVYQTICDEVTKNKEVINHLLSLDKNSQRWSKIIFQISKYRLFSTQLA